MTGKVEQAAKAEGGNHKGNCYVGSIIGIDGRKYVFHGTYPALRAGDSVTFSIEREKALDVSKTS